VHRLQFHYELSTVASPAPAREAQVRNPLIDLLRAVDQAGSISAAARQLGLSYRHVWGELKRWQDVLGHDLIVWEKGQAARLTEFASKLLWAEAQAQARLAPQIEALRTELERTFAVAFDDAAHVLTLYASHDDALAALREHALHLPTGPLHLDIRFTGSVDAIRALNEGRCVMAGFHTLARPPVGSLAQRTYKPLLQPGLHKVIGFATRVQGLMVAQGNPLGITSLADLTLENPQHKPSRKPRYINRALGTGTRLLLDELLAQSGLLAAQINGYNHNEPSHVAVAQSIAGGLADAGLGIEVAARSKGLDFVPLVQETYHLVCLKEALDQPAVTALRQLLATPEWQNSLNNMPGYHASASSDVLSLTDIFPWWKFREKR
jgi:putative molybdopterin biosynthesis protein